jgi:ankyrin repeat protein
MEEKKKEEAKTRGGWPAMNNNSSVEEKKLLKKHKPEDEYHTTLGLQNAFHLAVTCPQFNLIDLLVAQRVDPDKQDFRKMNPFNLASITSPLNFVDRDNQNLIKKLVSLGCRTDLPDSKGRTAFLNYFGASKIELAE